MVIIWGQTDTLDSADLTWHDRSTRARALHRGPQRPRTRCLGFLRITAGAEALAPEGEAAARPRVWYWA